MSVVQQVFESYLRGFLLGSNDWGATFSFSQQPPVLPGGRFCSDMLDFAYRGAMAREGLVLFVLVGFNGESVTRCL